MTYNLCSSLARLATRWTGFFTAKIRGTGAHASRRHTHARSGPVVAAGLAALALLALASPVLAAPLTFTCDPNPAEENVTEYRLYLDGVMVARTPAPPWPAVEITPGKHVIEATAANVWAESARSVPVLLPPLSTSPKAVRRAP